MHIVSQVELLQGNNGTARLRFVTYCQLAMVNCFIQAKLNFSPNRNLFLLPFIHTSKQPIPTHERNRTLDAYSNFALLLSIALLIVVKHEIYNYLACNCPIRSIKYNCPLALIHIFREPIVDLFNRKQPTQNLFARLIFENDLYALFLFGRFSIRDVFDHLAISLGIFVFGSEIVKVGLWLRVSLQGEYCLE